MLSVLITDFLQFVVMSIGLLVVTILILYQVGWGHLTRPCSRSTARADSIPSSTATFGWSFVIFQLFPADRATLTWQDHDRARARGQGHRHGAQDLHAHEASSSSAAR